MQDLIINFTPTGMVPTRADNPAVPTSVTEIVEEVHAAHELGITVAHLHARKDDGAPTLDVRIYEAILSDLRRLCPDLVLCVSLSGRKTQDIEERAAPLLLAPDMASLTLSSLNFPQQASINSPEAIARLAEKMLDAGVHPELEVFDLGMINYGKHLIHKGLLRPPHYWNLLFGNVAGMQPDPATIGLALRELPPESHCALAGIGASQLTANAIAVAIGIGVRVGLEDNLFFDRARKSPATNLGLLRRVHALAGIHDRRIMSPGAFGALGFYNRLRSRQPIPQHAPAR